ncbi:adhesion G protein-coupled receptor L3 isoform X1 [Tachysurus ichikawai]
MVETVNNLLCERAQPAWKALSVMDQLRCATMLLDTVETAAFMLADNLLKTDTIQESTDNIQPRRTWRTQTKPQKKQNYPEETPEEPREPRGNPRRTWSTQRKPQKNPEYPEETPEEPGEPRGNPKRTQRKCQKNMENP